MSFLLPPPGVYLILGSHRARALLYVSTEPSACHKIQAHQPTAGGRTVLAAEFDSRRRCSHFVD